ncbi:hypothetical protein F6E22_22555 [Vibrio vulnificus]|nr:hypothetical protein [Vibrio vulnificus]EGQ9330288.1 hypothetical protein [Vibrio vulnificus]EGR0089095.1 hypothetical protein [Vibrio vulnificus]EGR0107092.1 hypothetical protein [Vibrio vulnificus]
MPTSGRIGQKIHFSNSIPFASFRCNFDNLANAQLRGEQRLPQNLKHCAINTKFEVEAKVPSVVNPS